MAKILFRFFSFLANITVELATGANIIVQWILIIAFAVLLYGTIGGIFYGIYLIVMKLFTCGG